MPFVGVFRAAYDYSPQDDDELAIHQDEVCYLLEKVDDDWWRVRRRAAAEAANAEAEEVDGLVPASYLEEVGTRLSCI